MDLSIISHANREAWDEVEPIHARTKSHLQEKFRRPDYIDIEGIGKETLLRHGLQGKDVVQPCCNNGQNLLSIKRLGAGRCFGFDLSEAFIQQGRTLAAAGGIECELVQSDVYRLNAKYDGQFDIAYISAGHLIWLPDLDGFFAVVHRLLRPGGWMFMQEMHPLVDMYSMESSQRPGRRTRHSYFMDEPYESTQGLDYYGRKKYRGKPSYSFHHRLSDTVQAVVNSGMLLETIEERAEDASGGWAKKLKRKKHALPLSFVLTATRPGAPTSATAA